MYYLAEEKQFSSRAAFNAAVKLQGSGLTKDGRVRTYRGTHENPKPGCNTTATSSSRQCLLAYFSVAADLPGRCRCGKGVHPGAFRAGDIISVPGVKDQSVTLPNGRVIKHPGFFIVHDTGAAICGTNRFDFFTGTNNPLNHAISQAFTKAELGSRRSCSASFQLVTRDSEAHRAAYERIYQAQQSTTVIPPYPGGPRPITPQTVAGTAAGARR